MFLKFHEAKERREGGFTLIELLVVILIIAILAAIAIPVFLRQREKGWRSQVQSALKNAATAQESHLTVAGTYTANAVVTAGADNDLTDQGFKKATDVTVTIPVATGIRYCMEGAHTNVNGGAVSYHYDSDEGEPLPGTC
jgi:type IV pilus assembly protein PilA